MRISKYLALLPLTVLATPVVFQRATDPATHQFLLDHENLWGCAANDLYYPALDEYLRAAKLACKRMYPAPSITQYGFKRTVVDVAVFDRHGKRPMSFEVWQRKHTFHGQDMNEEICVKGFTEKWTGGSFEKYGPCKFEKKDGSKLVLVRSWIGRKEKWGSATVDFNANLQK